MDYFYEHPRLIIIADFIPLLVNYLFTPYPSSRLGSSLELCLPVAMFPHSCGCTKISIINFDFLKKHIYASTPFNDEAFDNARAKEGCSIDCSFMRKRFAVSSQNWLRSRVFSPNPCLRKSIWILKSVIRYKNSKQMIPIFRCVSEAHYHRATTRNFRRKFPKIFPSAIRAIYGI